MMFDRTLALATGLLLASALTACGASSPSPSAPSPSPPSPSAPSPSAPAAAADPAPRTPSRASATLELPDDIDWEADASGLRAWEGGGPCPKTELELIEIALEGAPSAARSEREEGLCAARREVRYLPLGSGRYARLTCATRPADADDDRCEAVFASFSRAEDAPRPARPSPWRFRATREPDHPGGLELYEPDAGVWTIAAAHTFVSVDDATAPARLLVTGRHWSGDRVRILLRDAEGAWRSVFDDHALAVRLGAARGPGPRPLQVTADDGGAADVRGAICTVHEWDPAAGAYRATGRCETEEGEPLYPIVEERPLTAEHPLAAAVDDVASCSSTDVRCFLTTALATQDPSLCAHVPGYPYEGDDICRAVLPPERGPRPARVATQEELAQQLYVRDHCHNGYDWILDLLRGAVALQPARADALRAELLYRVTPREASEAMAVSRERPWRSALATTLGFRELTGQLHVPSWTGLEDALTGTHFHGPSPGSFGPTRSLALLDEGRALIRETSSDEPPRTRAVTWRLIASPAGEPAVLEVDGERLLLSRAPDAWGQFFLQTPEQRDTTSAENLYASEAWRNLGSMGECP